MANLILGFPNRADSATLSGGAWVEPSSSTHMSSCALRFDLPLLSEEEGFSQALELTRRAGIHKEILVVADPDWAATPWAQIETNIPGTTTIVYADDLSNRVRPRLKASAATCRTTGHFIPRDRSGR